MLVKVVGIAETLTCNILIVSKQANLHAGMSFMLVRFLYLKVHLLSIFVERRVQLGPIFNLE